MKRIHFYVVLVLAVLFMAVVIFWQHSHLATNTTLTKVMSGAEAQTNSENVALLNNPAPAKTGSPESVQAATNPNDRLAKMGITPDMTREQREKKFAEWYISEAAKLVPKQEPIAFYGKVVNEETQAVAGASIHFILSDASSRTGTTNSDTVSAGDGSFFLINGTGSGVSVYVSKNGYYEIKSLNQINYDPTGNGSSKENPVLFHLRKKGVGADLITSKYGFTSYFDVHVPIDGQTIKVDFLNRSAGNNGQIEFSNIKPEYLQARQANEWSFKMIIADGGFVEESDEFPFEAPENGYQPVVQFYFQKGQTNWADSIHKDFYTKFGNPPRFGRIHLDTSIGSGVRLSYAINPDGSRDLEPKP